MQKQIDRVEVFAIESTTVKPIFEVYPPGIRSYKLENWDSLGNDDSHTDTNIDLLNIDEEDQYCLKPGEVPILEEIYLALRDFNPRDNEPPLNEDQVILISFQVGELIFMTLPPNKNGWFEGYRANDPDRMCAISHISALKKINFK